MSYDNMIRERKPTAEILEAQKKHWDSLPNFVGGPLSAFDLVDNILKVAGDCFSNKKILDYGSGGISRLMQGMKEHNIEVLSYTGADISKILLTTASGRFPQYTYVLLEDNETLPFIDSYFDTVVMYSVLTHTSVEQDIQILKAIRRVLVKDGILIFTIFDIEVGADGICKSIDKTRKILEETGYKIVSEADVPEITGTHQHLFKVTK